MVDGGERNAPCPCGSGKKYKKCCNVISTTPVSSDVIINRVIAYKGNLGRQRERICQEYIATKRTVTQSIKRGLTRDAAAADKTISCFKGCGECCSTYYIAASLQECEAIVYWLYQHDEILLHFLQTITGWQTLFASASDCLDTINQLYGKVVLSQATDEERQTFRSAMHDYESRHITCPFLKNGACYIYEVRPYVCASVVSLSPYEWCRQSHPDHSRMIFLKTELPLAKDMPYFVRPKSGILFAAMPMLVHDILREGYAALSAIPGLEVLRQVAMSDPEVLDVLKRSVL